MRVCGFNILMCSEVGTIVKYYMWNCLIGESMQKNALSIQQLCGRRASGTEKKNNIHRITIIANHIEQKMLSIPIFDIHRLLYRNRKREKKKWNIEFSIHLVAFTHALVVHCSSKNEWNSYLSQFALSIPKLLEISQ